MRTPTFLTAFAKTLRVDLRQHSGVDAAVKLEHVKGTKLFRIYVVAAKFSKLWHSERQSLVWRIADRALSPEQSMRISMIVTLSTLEWKE